MRPATGIVSADDFTRPDVLRRTRTRLSSARTALMSAVPGRDL
jgi:hypothetical protein